MITLGISQRESDRVLEAMGLKKKKGEDASGDTSPGGSNGENPRRIFRVALYGAFASIVAAGIVWAGKQAGTALLDGVRAEISVHHAVAVHTHQLDDHEHRLQYVEAQAKAQVVLPPEAAAQVSKLITLLEADAKARANKPVTP